MPTKDSCITRTESLGQVHKIQRLAGMRCSIEHLDLEIESSIRAELGATVLFERFVAYLPVHIIIQQSMQAISRQIPPLKMEKYLFRILNLYRQHSMYFQTLRSWTLQLPIFSSLREQSVI